MEILLVTCVYLKHMTFLCLCQRGGVPYIRNKRFMRSQNLLFLCLVLLGIQQSMACPAGLVLSCYDAGTGICTNSGSFRWRFANHMGNGKTMEECLSYCSGQDGCTGGMYRQANGDCRLYDSTPTCGPIDSTCWYCHEYNHIECGCAPPPGCDAGQVLIDGVCVDCGPGTYQPNSAYTGDCIFCPDNSYSQWASDAATDCTCNKGYMGPNGGTCTACAFGTYKDVIGPVDCTSCPANSYSQSASESVTECTCNRGFAGSDGGPCVECEAGKFKNGVGSGSCVHCLEHSNNEFFVHEGTTFSSDRVGLFTSTQAGSSTCGDCVANAEPSSGTCKCSAGYYRVYTFQSWNGDPPNVDRCDPCPVNTFKSTVGVVAGCISDSSWTDGYDNCDAYENNILNTDEDWCGYSAAGYGDSRSHCCICTDYDTVNYDAVDPATMIWVQSQCTTCPANSYASTTANEDATACQCNAGYTGPDGGPCVACAEGTYKDAVGSAECTACAQHETSPQGSESADACVCQAGYQGGGTQCTYTWGDPCKKSGENTELPSGNNLIATNDFKALCCDASGFQIRKNSAGQCWSGSGGQTINGVDYRFGVSSTEAVALCAHVSIEQGSEARLCTKDELSLSVYGINPNRGCASGCGLDDTLIWSTEAACDAWAGTCSQCPSGKYKPYDADTACDDCPANSVDVSGQYCICNAGYHLSAPDTCLQCDVGTWKSGSGNATGGCTTCGEHMTTLNTESTGIESCLCNAGYYGNYDACQSCATGTYTNSVGNTICTDCPVGSSSLTNTNDEESDCVADVGYEKLNGVYTECNIGFYKNTIESIACSECAHGSTTASTGSTQNTQCECISPNYYGNAGEECLCAGGYARWHEDDHTHATIRRLLSHEDCNLCEAGKYCPAEIDSGGVQLLSSETVPQCPENSNSPAGSSSQTDCICDAGYTGPDGGPCVQCGVGTYKDAAGSQGCTACAQHETSPMGSASLGACVCEAGYGYDGSICTECAVGSYKDVSGDLGCTSCAQHETSPEGSVSADACVCVAGYGSTSTYTYSVQSGRYCAQDYWGTVGPDPITIEECADHCSADENCKQFEIESTHLTDLYYCMLCSHDLTYAGAGFFVYVKDTEPSFVCSECVAGKYKDAIGDVVCTDCAQHETSPDGSVSADACVCSGGFELTTNTELVSNWGTALGKMCDRNQGTTAFFANYGSNADAVNACKELCLNNVEEPYTFNFFGPCVGVSVQHNRNDRCNLCRVNAVDDVFNSGSYNTYALTQATVTEDICQGCAAGKYKPADADTACDNCPADATSPTGSDELTDCFCNAGFSGSNGGACTICPTDTYQDTPGSSTCEACPENSQSPEGSVVGDACLCNAGYEELTDSVCTTCPNGKFKTSASHDQCSQCRSHANTVSDGSTLSSECLCNAGYYDNGGTCTQCSSGTYKTGLGDGACTSCPDNSDSPQGSTLENQCICNAGYEISVSGASISCAACDPNFYEDSYECVQCPPNSQSAALSTSVSDCKCNQGYTGPDGGECVACGTDKYKDSVGSSSCTSCEANMNSPTASTTPDACLCNAGFSRDLGASVNRRLLSLSTCQSCLADTYCPPENTVETTSVNVCPDNSNSPAGSDELTDCKCNKGYAGPDGQACQICDYNYYTDAIGSPTCLACPEYSTTTNQASISIDLCECDQYYKRSGSGESTVCHRECGPGFEASDDESRCVGCRVSHYKPDYGDHDCTKCPGVSYSLVQNQTALNSCICPQGYLWNGTWCHQCAADTFNNRANQTACFDCITDCDTYSGRRRLLSSHVPGANPPYPFQYWPFYNLNTAGTDIGGWVDLGPGTATPSSYPTDAAIVIGQQACLDTPECIYVTFKAFYGYSDGFKDTASYKLQSAFSYWRRYETYWISVKPSWVGPTYNAQAMCDNKITSWWRAVDAVHNYNGLPVIQGPGIDICEICNTGPNCIGTYYGLIPEPTIEAASVESASHTTCPGLCRAPAGYRVNADGNNVELCPANHYQTGDAANCTKCPSPSTYSSEGGLTSVTDCECSPGYTRVGGSEGTCEPCLTGTYKVEPGDGACVLCGDNANTVEEASDSVLDCLCQAGYTQSGDQCAACAEGNTKHILSNVSCIQCPEHSTLYQDKQHHIDHCQCDPGYSGLGGNNPCVACEVGKFSVLHGNEMQCHDCPIHATTESVASKNESFCVCETLYEPSQLGGPWDGYDCISSCGPGLTGTGFACEKCAVGSFKTQRGGESCTLCTGVRSNSRVGSISSTNCSCVQGKFGVNSSKFVVIDSVGGWSESGVKVVSDFTQASSTSSEFTYNLLDGEAYRSVLLKPGGLDLDVLDWQINVKIDNLMLFSCTFKDCPEEKEVSLSGFEGVLKVSGYVKANGNLQLYTRKTLTLQSSYSFWNDQLQAQAENLVARKRNRAGDYIFISQNVFSDSACINCPPKLNCKEFI